MNLTVKLMVIFAVLLLLAVAAVLETPQNRSKTVARLSFTLVVSALTIQMPEQVLIGVGFYSIATYVSDKGFRWVENVVNDWRGGNSGPPRQT